MDKSNKVSAELLDTDKDAVLAKLDEIAALLPFLISLTKTERENLRKMGPKSVEYVTLGVQGAVNFPKAMTVGFNTAEYKKDAQLIAQLLPIQVKAQSIMEQINDTFMAVGSDSIMATDEVYGDLKRAAKKDTTAKAIVDQMAQRFKGQGKKKPKP
jgi:hypothetical protein